MSYGYVQYIWILLSILVAVTCSFCFLQPEWIVRVDTVNTLGLYSFCLRSRSVQMSRVCGFYGGRFGFGNIPSTSWQAACLLYGGGSLFTCFGALCSLATMCARSTVNRTLVLSTRYLQGSSVMLMAIGLLVFPLGFDSPFFRQHCDVIADVYNVGACAVGWTYVLAIVGCAISMFCPVLSYFLTSSSIVNSDSMVYKL